MASKSRRRAIKPRKNTPSRGATNRHSPQDAARALKELRTIGGLLVRSSVGLLNGDAADQFVWLGQQIQTHAEQGMAALNGAATPSARPRRSTP